MLKKLPLYSLFYSIFAVVFLAAYNAGQIPISAIFRPLIAYILFGLALHGLAQIFLRDWHRSALVALFLLVMFTVYGQIYDFVKFQMGAGTAAIHHGSLLPWYCLACVVILYLIIRKVKNAEAYTFWLNFTSFSLLIHPLFVLMISAYQQWSLTHAPAERAVPVTVNTEEPDIYYIILDAYGRADVLLDRLGFDNSEFLNALRQRGFYVADCSQSNYAYTDYSLSSSLNFNYLEQLDADSEFKRALLLKHSRIRSFLEANGYEVVAFPTGWVFTEWHDADFYLNYPHSALSLTEYETFLVHTTMLRALDEVDRDLFNQVNVSLQSPRRLRTLSLLSHLKQLPTLEGKLFVYAHLMVPHPPYSFAPDGQPSNFREDNTTPQGVVDAYVNQIKFINREILTAIDVILSESEIPPVIIIQGDHGPAPELSPTYSEKMPILNAYFFPGKQAKDLLYPTISPVNTFRVVLNSYFGERLPLLDDKSYYAPSEETEAYTLVPNSCPQ